MYCIAPGVSNCLSLPFPCYVVPLVFHLFALAFLFSRDFLELFSHFIFVVNCLTFKRLRRFLVSE